MDVSKLSISCLAKRYRLVCRNAESRNDDDDDDGHGASERFHCRGTSNRGIMGIVCCWISIQAASSQQQRRTSHFFRFGDSTLPLLLRSLPCIGLLDSSPVEKISESFRQWTRLSWPANLKRAIQRESRLAYKIIRLDSYPSDRCKNIEIKNEHIFIN